ncbi:Putative Transcriptional activator spt7 [[Torrubiella] hemipterigena]|uniref:Putative Transcriptional activator spt7 n=1 Tax=[Torrubiella] hemipterigena TaxID=1531966 RepID=A0A0A1TLL2_9HYPO|nr:Putative Transcriptional activator spt7 [[Torrubiella] hemipterigena]
MSFTNGQPAWPSPALHHSNSSRSLHLVDDASARTQTPVDNSMTLVPEAPVDAEEEARRALFADLYRNTEDKIAFLFKDDGSYNVGAIQALRRDPIASAISLPPTTDHEPIKEPPAKKAKRTIDEDDYDDDEEEEEEPSQPLTKSHTSTVANPLLSPSKSGSSPVHSVNSPSKQPEKPKDQESKEKEEQEAIKKLEEARLETERAARRSFHTIMYTLENDRMAMLEQQQLEDSEKQLQAEMDHNHQPGSGGQGTLASANLGASSLTLKHLIARIDIKRDQVRASDAELRVLMSEVRKNRSKWASEENVNQEDLYEALDKVLTELKAHTEYSMPFLSRVNKRDAPDYYNLIKNPMDLGSMTKKLKSLTYKSKVEFVADLNLIWDNCLKYNQEMTHPLRRMANGMRKEAEKLIPLIPDLVIRSRADVEAEERRKQNDGEDSDDEPIMSSRGRQTGTKGTAKSRTAPADAKEDTPVIDQKPVLQLNGLLAKSGREGSEFDGSTGLGTPPVGGTGTPTAGGVPSGIASNADAMEIDGPSLNGMALGQAFGVGAEQIYEDEEYKIWKQTTKKDRALAAKERHLLFTDRKLNADAPALLRSKAGMRQYLKHLNEADTLGIGPSSTSAALKGNEAKQSETLAEGINDEEDKVVPDYYTSLTNIPDIPSKLRWIEDGEGQVINQHEEFLHVVPEGSFIAPKSKFSKKMDENIRQIQETRKIATKISVVKQMQVQAQVYTNQFPRSNTDPFLEQDIEPHFISDNGPVMALDACQAALRRSISKVLYNTGFEEVQPSVLDTFTGIAGDYFQKLCHTFNVYREAEKTSIATESGFKTVPRFSPEEVILHTLDESGHDLATLDYYVNEDVERLSSRLGGLHERMKTHLADLLRPALAPEAGADGVGAFKDGSDQFTSGDFAEDLGEDFFGFRALGLDKEMGLHSFQVPFHLLQSRVHSQYQMQNQGVSNTSSNVFEALLPSEPVTVDLINDQIGLVKNFFLAKLHANKDQPLIEDEDLPFKQRKPRPRLGASGKIMSAQKRPPREQIALAKKRKKLEAQAARAAAAAAAAAAAGGTNGTPAPATTPSKKKSISVTPVVAPNRSVSALGSSMERMDSMQSQGNTSQQTDTGMMSPQSNAE